MNKIITINRQYGSGGREIGQKLAEEFGVPFYDNEIISQAAKETGFSEAAFKSVEDKATNSLLYSIAMGMNVFSGQDMGYAGLSLDDRIFLAQSNVIREVASEGPCVIVGRCADYILKDLDHVVNIFIQANLDYRIQRATQVDHLDPRKAAETVARKDKSRANYYRYHAGERWDSCLNYHLMLRSDRIDLNGAVHCIKGYVESMKE